MSGSSQLYVLVDNGFLLGCPCHFIKKWHRRCLPDGTLGSFLSIDKEKRLISEEYLLVK